MVTSRLQLPDADLLNEMVSTTTVVYTVPKGNQRPAVVERSLAFGEGRASD